jgi:glucose dehydrogenase
LSRKQADLIFSLALLALIAWMVWEAGKWDLRARLFPLAVGVPAIVLALVQLAFLLKPAQTRSTASAPDRSTPEAGPAAAAPAPGATGVVMAEAIERAFGPGSASQAEEAVEKSVARARALQMVGWVLAIAVGIVQAAIGFLVDLFLIHGRLG